MPTVIDLSHVIASDMPVYPGTERPVVSDANTIERDGFAEKLISMYSHTGTHLDAPAHMLADGPTLDQLDVEHFVGRARAIDVSREPVVERCVLEAHAEDIEGCRFVLLRTGWSRHWGQDSYFEGFPVLSTDAARWLAGRGLEGIGVDTISVDPVGSKTFANHLALFGAGMVIIENLTDLGPLVGRTFLFSCLPLRIRKADGSPVRAVAILDQP